MSIKGVRNGIINALFNSGVLTQANTAVQNMQFKPTTDVWYSVSFMCGEPITTGIGAEATERFVGIAQVDVNIKSGIGDVSAIDETVRIANILKRGDVIDSGATKILITKVWLGQSDLDGGWYTTPVYIRWQAEINVGGF